MIGAIADFYLKYNYFKAKENFVGIREITDDRLKTFLFIKQNKKSILDTVNFVFINSNDSFDLITYADKESPLVFINLNSKKTISYLVLYAISAIFIGLNFKFDFNVIAQNQIKSEIYDFFDSIASNSYSGEDFDIYYQVSEKLTDKVFQLGKKLCFSSVLALDDKKISNDKFIKLIGLNLEDSKKFNLSYLPMARLNLLKGSNA